MKINNKYNIIPNNMNSIDLYFKSKSNFVNTITKININIF